MVDTVLEKIKFYRKAPEERFKDSGLSPKLISTRIELEAKYAVNYEYIFLVLCSSQTQITSKKLQESLRALEPAALINMVENPQRKKLIPGRLVINKLDCKGTKYLLLPKEPIFYAKKTRDTYFIANQ